MNYTKDKDLQHQTLEASMYDANEKQTEDENQLLLRMNDEWRDAIKNTDMTKNSIAIENEIELSTKLLSRTKKKIFSRNEKLRNDTFYISSTSTMFNNSKKDEISTNGIIEKQIHLKSNAITILDENLNNQGDKSRNTNTNVNLQEGEGEEALDLNWNHCPIKGHYFDLMNRCWVAENGISFLKREDFNLVVLNYQQSESTKNTKKPRKEKKRKIEDNIEKKKVEQVIYSKENIFDLKTPMGLHQRRCYKGECRYSKPSLLIIKSNESFDDIFIGNGTAELISSDYHSFKKNYLDARNNPVKLKDNACHFQDLKFKICSPSQKFILKFTITFKKFSDLNSPYQTQIVYSDEFNIYSHTSVQKKEK